MWPLVLVALATAPAVPTLLDVEDPWQPKGAFANDTWLPHDLKLERILAGADEALGANEAGADLGDVFGAWSSALGSVADGAWVRWDTRMHWETTEGGPPLWNDRRIEGVLSAILLRQSERGGALHGPWTRFVEAEADAALAAALTLPVERSRMPLSALSARYPGTRASVRAALFCSELDRERGRTHHARSWLSRAEHGARLLADEDLLSAVTARRVTPDAHQAEPWETANGWKRIDIARLTDYPDSPALGVRGITRWNTEGVFIQSAEFGWTLGTEGSAMTFELRELAARAGQPLTWDRTAVPGPDWHHRPSAHGDLVFIVLGHVHDARSNALFAFRPGVPPVPRWSVGRGGWRDADGNLISSLTDALGPGAWEFQPGPLVIDDLLIAQARRWDLKEGAGRTSLVDPARAEAVALALDISSGALVWRTSLARGSDIYGETGKRFVAARTPSRSAPPPILCGSSLVFATGLGACVALDLVDGRPQRAVLGQRVESGLSFAASPVATSDTSVLWAPHGGEAAYELALGPAHPTLTASPFVRTPRTASDWSSIIGSRGGRPLVVIARGGRHQVELAADGATQARRSVQLSPGEVLLGAHALGSERLLTVSDRGLFVFDLERELYLVGHVPLKPSVVCLPDGLVAAGSWAWALTGAGVYRLRVSEDG